jgi:hypothetical protein
MAALTASAFFRRANNDLLDTRKMAGECLAAGMLGPRFILSLVRRLFLFVFTWCFDRLAPALGRNFFAGDAGLKIE